MTAPPLVVKIQSSHCHGKRRYTPIPEIGRFLHEAPQSLSKRVFLSERRNKQVLQLFLPLSVWILKAKLSHPQSLLASSSFRSFGAGAGVVGCPGLPAIGRCQPRRIAMNRITKQRTAPAIVTAVDGSRNAVPITTVAAPARAATA